MCQQFRFRRCGQRAKVGKPLKEPLIVRDDGSDAGLLQHNFRYPDAIRIGCLTPGQGALIGGEPAKQIAPKLFGLPRGERTVRHLILVKELLSEQ